MIFQNVGTNISILASTTVFQLRLQQRTCFKVKRLCQNPKLFPTEQRQVCKVVHSHLAGSLHQLHSVGPDQQLHLSKGCFC